MSLKDLAMDAFYHPERGGQLSAESSIKTTTNPPAFGCTFVNLTVDIALCKVTSTASSTFMIRAIFLIRCWQKVRYTAEWEWALAGRYLKR